ncbi:CcdC family protein [Fictibacillus iocasae]|uniref:CcdC family protein n=1 Tax=Fictibacillus iocasae TaxID=2715437 RepID=A0ABW2NW72_9BACL
MFIAISGILAIVMAFVMMGIRMKASKKPVSLKKIMLPPLFMSTGFAMFLFPVFQISFIKAGEAFLTGVVFSLLLIMTTKFERRADGIYMVMSKAFVFIFAGLFIVRLLMKIYFEQHISYEETSGIFFIIAFGMLLPWRMTMAYRFKQINKPA